MTLRPFFILVVGLAALSACGEEERESTYPGDPSAAIVGECMAYEQSGRACDGSCTTARLNATFPASIDFSCPAIADLNDLDEEMDSYIACVATCPDTLVCPSGGALRECECVADCAAQGSAYFEGLLAHEADCLRELPECQ